MRGALTVRAIPEQGLAGAGVALSPRLHYAVDGQSLVGYHTLMCSVSNGDATPHAGPTASPWFAPRNGKRKKPCPQHAAAQAGPGVKADSMRKKREEWLATKHAEQLALGARTQPSHVNDKDNVAYQHGQQR